MFTLETRTLVERLTGGEVFAFFVEPSDAAYRAWWPGVHLQLHVVARGDDRHIGDVLLMDEYVGTRRMRLHAIVEAAAPGARLVWRLRAGARLPVWASLDFDDVAGGVVITHRIRAGWQGWARCFDPVFRLYLSRSFAAALDAHVHEEFRLLGQRLHPAPG